MNTTEIIKAIAELDLLETRHRIQLEKMSTKLLSLQHSVLSFFNSFEPCAHLEQHPSLDRLQIALKESEK